MAQSQGKSDRKDIIVYAGIISVVLVQFLLFWRFWARIKPNISIWNLIKILGNLGVLFSFIMVIWSLLNLFLFRKKNIQNIVILIVFIFLVIISLMIMYNELFSLPPPQYW